MVLASQTPRNPSSWQAMSSRSWSAGRRRRPGRTLAIGLLVLATGVAVVWAVYPRGDRPSQTPDEGGEEASGAPREARVAAPPEPDRLDSARGARTPERPADPPVLVLGGSGEPRGGGGTAPSGVDPSGSSSSESSRRTTDPQGGGAAPTQPEATSPKPPAPTIPERTAADRSAADGARSAAAAPDRVAGAAGSASRDPVTARRQLTALATDARLTPAERTRAREALAGINRELLFSSKIVPGDPYARSYVVQPGDTLQKIARREGLDADWRLIKRVNGIADERRIRVGQTLKLVPGTFHAVVSKRDYRMDIYLGEGDARVLVLSLPVGLGEYDSTPLGRFKVRPQSKLVNPAWTNPRTGEHYRADDPKNPIGEHWIGVVGIDEANKGIEAIGLHGTIEPESIGRQASMGCVRMLAADIALVYELLTEPNSTITIAE